MLYGILFSPSLRRKVGINAQGDFMKSSSKKTREARLLIPYLYGGGIWQRRRKKGCEFGGDGNTV